LQTHLGRQSSVARHSAPMFLLRARSDTCGYVGELFTTIHWRICSIGRVGSYSVNYSWSFFRTLCSALMHVSGVTTLYLSFLDPIPEPYLRGLELCSFPNLRFLFIKMNLTISVLIFICRNSRYIRDLHINCGAPRYRITAPLSTFPELESFSGRCCLTPPFLSGTPV